MCHYILRHSVYFFMMILLKGLKLSDLNVVKPPNLDLCNITIHWVVVDPLITVRKQRITLVGIRELSTH